MLLRSLYLVGIQERISITNRLFTNQPATGVGKSRAGPSARARCKALGVLPALGPGSPGMGLGTQEQPQHVSCVGGGSQPGRGEKSRRAADLLAMCFLGEICRFCEKHKTAKWSSKRSRNLR